MGPLTIPVGSRVCIDTQIVIYTTDNHPTYGPALKPLWRAAARGEARVLASELAWMEALVLPIRQGRDQERAKVEHLLSTAARLSPVSRPVLLRGAELRAARVGLHTPDAVHLATAEILNCTMFLTNDRRLRGVANVPVVILDEVLAP